MWRVLPAWATVLVAVVGSALAGVAVGLLRMRHDRSESFRDRMLTAADDLATGLMQAVLVAGHVVGELEDYLIDEKQPEGRGDLRELRRLIDEATARLARVELLFGVGSVTVERANAVLGCLRRVPYTLQSGGNLHRRLDEAVDEYQAAASAYRAFSAAAREAVATYGRFRSSVRRPEIPFDPA
jgi:hypothetical protein